MGDQIVSQSDYLGITEAAEYLRVSASTLRRWEKKGFLIPERTPTGIRRYTKQQLDAVLQQGPQLLVDEEPYVASTYEQQYSYNDTQAITEYAQPVEDIPSSTPESMMPQSLDNQSQQDPFISSHRYSPPPTYAPPSPPRVNTYAYDQTFSSPIKMPGEDVQSSLNELSSSVYQPSPAYHSPAPIAQPERASSYADDYDFDEGEEMEEPQPVAQSIPVYAQSKDAKPSRSVFGGLAMFLGVFVGILIITAGIWFGFMYFSGGMGSTSLLSPIP